MKLKEKLSIRLRKIKYHNIFKQMKQIKILNDKDSVDLIINSKKSVARFGDGELGFVFSPYSKIGFQNSNKELSERLTEIIKSDNENVIIGLPDKFVTLRHNTYESKKFWLRYIIDNYKNILNNVNLNRIYINTNFTRFYFDYQKPRLSKKKIKNVKRIWDNRDIVIIEGEKTKIGVGNDFFDNAKSIKRIICPSTNAFLRYDKILKEATKLEKDKLILIALGPTATVLAYDLGNIGYQALDVGHIDIEYEWYLKKAKEKVAIDGKYVNEANKNNYDIDIDDEKYKKSIIKNITIS